MAKKKTTEQFIAEATKVHKGKYDYSLSTYTGANEKVVVVCVEHGEFQQHASSHLAGAGCRKCANLKNTKYTTKSYIAKVRRLHRYKFTYGSLEYKGYDSKVQVTCKKHGDFFPTAGNHLKGSGCPGCAEEKRGSTQKLTTDEFLGRAKDVHGSNYDYSKVEYRNTYTNVTILCSKHGEFKQTPHSHIGGKGCPQCGRSSTTEHARVNAIGWSHSEWENAGNSSSNFEGFSLYVIRCTSGSKNEDFIKVGKTFVGTAKRFCGKDAMPYKYRVITQVYYNAYAISKLEEKVKKVFREYKYLPKKKFCGMHECLHVDALPAVLEMVEK